MVKSLQKKVAHFNSPKQSSDPDAKPTFKSLPFNVQEIERPVEPLPTEAEGEAEKAEVKAPTGDFFEQDCHFICQSFLQLPAVLWGKHLIRKEEQVKPFSHAFYNYCLRKGINPFDYFFDELPLIITGIGLVKGMRDDHLKFKKEQKEKKNEA